MVAGWGVGRLFSRFEVRGSRFEVQGMRFEMDGPQFFRQLVTYFSGRGCGHRYTTYHLTIFGGELDPIQERLDEVCCGWTGLGMCRVPWVGAGDGGCEEG